ncbi:APC membrane recruitment protein 1 [Thamnophis elegans]|uniref:APC membrane recruitment protein 1 n=1 Tax=Thamnophis elegans TaxID=35005 RepID=UPI001378DD34|nr:APC membrane recruitment protein 1 [Thamnophis elegans]
MMQGRMAAVEAADILQNPRAKSLLAKDRKESQEENGAASHLSKPRDASFAGAEPNLQQAPASKLKKTAFKFFGGKRSICTLPSFFGGKNKSQAKGASKKGLSKSKTHDGISDVAHEEATSGCLRSSSDGGPDFPPAQLLPSSQSSLLGTELRVGFTQSSNFLSSNSEGFEKKLTGEKSLFLPRSKKGLKGLFNSIRRHRKNKVAEPEKTELQEWALRDTGTKEQTHGSGLGRSLQSGTVTPECVENFSADAVPQIANHNETGEMDCLASCPVRSIGEAARGPASLEGFRDGQPNLEDVCADSAYGDLPDAFEPEFLEKNPPCLPSREQLSLMFGEVTSLKSFDSFTGCGDIIAEPDIDSITESSTSVERSRDATKRTSCLVTYQGGGEEMALPEDLEEYLQQMWAGAIKGDVASEAHLPELITKCDLQGMDGGKQEVNLYTEGTRNDIDLLTPHSDQQESAPNSDEGYYDSTTPGPEDEAIDGLDEIKKDRLPRDSYSGDALYEFYEPDDALMSPSHGDGSWFDGKLSPSKIFDQFLDFALLDEKDLIWLMDQKSEVMETEEQRLATLQKQLLFGEMQREPALKHLQELRRDQHLRPGQLSECKMQTTHLVGKSSSCLGCEQMNFCALNKSLSGGKKLAENQDWEDDLHKQLYPEKLCDSNSTTKAHNSCLLQPLENGSELGSSDEHPVLDSRALASGNSVTFPLYRVHGHHGCSPKANFQEPCQERNEEPEQAVNFSQALVEFTSNGTLFSSLSESLRSSDSGSEFTQNLPDLPTMVTFDIVDVEQEGEGECEEHLQMNTDEDMTASFEAFRDTYDSKAPFAECDERMFSEYPQISFHWGAASLPRRLRLQELNAPLLEPLSICRRSRSLDNESLEFELASLQLFKKSFRPFELCSGSKKDPGPLGLDNGQEGVPHSPGEREEAIGGLSWPGRLNVPHGKAEISLQETKTGETSWHTLPSQSPWGILEHSDKAPPLAHLGQNSTKEPAGHLHADGSNHPVLPALRPLTRPSTLFLQAPVMSPEGSTPQRPGGDSLSKKHAWVLPLGKKELDLPLSFNFPCSSDKPSMYKPRDVAQGTSQLHTEQC